MSSVDYSPARTLLRAAHQHPHRASLIDAQTGAVLSVSQSSDHVRRTTTVLAGLGIGEGSRVVLCTANSPWHFIVHVACSWLGAVSVVVSPRLPEGEIRHRINLAHGALVIVDSAQMASDLSLAHFKKMVDSAHPMMGEPPRRTTEVAAILFTSGSTAQARPIELTHEVLWWGTRNFRDGFEYSPGHHVVGVCAPMSHIGGFNGTSLDTFAHGGTVVVFESFNPELILRGVEQHRISMMFAVPTMCIALLEAQRTVEADLSSWVKPLVGGDALTPLLREHMRQAGLDPIHVWGMTETSGAGAMMAPDAIGPAGAIGRPFPYVDLRICDEAGIQVEQGSIGEIQVRGPGVVTGSKWLRTADLGFIDEGGWIHLVGRASRMINTGGELVAPAKIEEALRTLAGITDAMVVGLEDERWGQIVAAAIVLAPGGGTGDLTSLQFLNAQLANVLAPWERIRRMTTVDAIPLSVNGKPDPQAVIRLFA
ncbi:class I adenylate-forming enzyme family protein [Schaalia vaccimaxillae]|uniref:class I adenylate-forming enzyme family protein n=1 Tax=Schaalia vaccimaxillae TaxID=183916 RepID=UPI0003B771DB|nr:class I adenylate-forming enzyme family protein [Schaalia vaccimaxillae]